MELGSWAEWVGGAASIAAAVLSVAALKTARAANGLAKDTREDVAERDRKREQAAVAEKIQAWWAVWDLQAPQPTFGICVTNGGGGASVFRDVKITASGNKNAGRAPIVLQTLPPGQYVVKSNNAGAPTPWAFPEVAPADVIPLLKAMDRSVERLEFVDPVGIRWRQEKGAPLTVVS